MLPSPAVSEHEHTSACLRLLGVALAKFTVAACQAPYGAWPARLRLTTCGCRRVPGMRKVPQGGIRTGRPGHTDATRFRAGISLGMAIVGRVEGDLEDDVVAR
jgi:hypothetical protein